MNYKPKSFLPFTDEELEQLNFTPEELDILETASAYSQTEEMIPDDTESFIKKINENFSDSDDSNATMQKLTDLCSSDPDFVNQMIALQEVYSAIKIYEDEEQSENRK